MPEQNLIINHKKISYHGIFRTDDFFSVINAALAEKGYTKVEKKSEELVTPGGRLFQLELRPFKSVSHYVNLMIKIHLTFDNITEITKEKHGITQKFQQGDLLILFDAWSITDYEGRWGTKPWTYFLKGVIHKYIYKLPQESGYTSQLVSDTAYIYGQVKNLLQSYGGKKTSPITEEEVRKKMEEEMAENPQ